MLVWKRSKDKLQYQEVTKKKKKQETEDGLQMQHLSLCWIATTTADSPDPSVKLSRIYISKPRGGDVKSTSFNNHIGNVNIV